MATLYSVASLSWIDPKSGLPEVDKNGDPGYALTKSGVIGGRLYRFANLLEVQLDISNGAIQNPQFTKDSGMYRGPSYMGLDSAPVGMIGRKIIPAGNAVTFRQIVGCRTESPEKIGQVAGGAVGAGAGAAGGAKVGAAIGTIGGLPGAIVGGVIGAGVGAVGGYFAGREVAELATAFPPIWTELELTVRADGSMSQRVISHSLFPSMTFYVLKTIADRFASDTLFIREGSSYDGVPNLEKWKKKGWGLANEIHRSGPTEGSPWGMEDPGPVLGVGKMHTQCPSGYECRS